MIAADSVYRAWAPDESIWSRWVKPVLFAHVPGAFVAQETAPDEPKAEINWIEPGDGTLAIIIDLPGPASVLLGLSLAACGYRPIPLFNAVPAPFRSMSSTGTTWTAVDMAPLVRNLAQGEAKLGEFNLSPKSPPAFLLDARRRGRSVILSPGSFDNRSISLPTDFPSGNFLIGSGVERVLVVHDTPGHPQQDLSHTLRHWQEAGLRILQVAPGSGESPAPIVIHRPPWFRHFWYGLIARMRLRRSPLGGFGGFIPVPSAG